MGAPGPIILFDGVCNLCNQSVQFVIRHDPRSKFRFAALQSDFGQQQLREHHFDTEEFVSVILVVGNKAYDRSRAALEIARRLNGLWPLLYVFVIVPPFIRNFVYDWISKNRYRWFGKKDECMIPTPELKSRFY
ncbi:MAG: thiol-disulfide oxidoreductase DCC family protein [Bacteroidota bacterium]